MRSSGAVLIEVPILCCDAENVASSGSRCASWCVASCLNIEKSANVQLIITQDFNNTYVYKNLCVHKINVISSIKSKFVFEKCSDTKHAFGITEDKSR